ncbi:isochorismate synthase MenF [Yimella sp. cx-51]|uniref:isochorismate synthase n=1 Tax=Yimella sp. cx-51 TaxID=2770551 RepID=UPI00165E4B1C|nr:isochorismate synthase [Yimella sp. cx-51]MBC9956287.1 isochorismate synthase [Yimella sp. cx-51]QTH38575.1 isochorismate synthase [Yimella sp. cx-51]
MTLPLVDAAPPTLVARTTQIPDPRDLARLVPSDVAPQDIVCWLRGGEGLIGWGRAASITTSGEDRFEAATAWWESVASSAVVRGDIDLPGTGPIAFGTFAFSRRSEQLSTLVVPEVIVGRRDGRSWVTHVTTADRLPGSHPSISAQTATPPGELSFRTGSLSRDEWADAVAESVRRIQNGRLDKVVMARDVVATSSSPIDLRWLLANLATDYSNTWTFAVDGMVGATPEMLLRREKGLVTSRVLAGTIRRTGDDERDLGLAAGLARSSKDLEEHEYAVRSVAEALRPHCSSMNVPESPFVLHLPNVMHLATDVTAVLRDGASSLALAAALHPSAAVCGTPTQMAAEVIHELERMDRGRYAGPVGWLDVTGDGEWGIALRSGMLDPKDDRSIRLFAGCGIVAGSVPEAELAESDAKLLPMRGALIGRAPGR